jgi:hypothetical protein
VTKSTSRKEKTLVHAMQGIKFQVTLVQSFFLLLTQPNKRLIAKSKTQSKSHNSFILKRGA